MQRFSPDPDSPYTIDECKIRGRADSVSIPDDEEELRSEISRCNDSKIPVTVNAMRTGLCGGGVPEGGEVISLERLDRMIGLGVRDDGYFLRTQPCVTVRKLRDTVMMKHIDGFSDVTPGACELFLKDKRRFFYPVDPTEMDSSIGGNIAANSSGPRTFKYGPTRNWVISIKVILADGSAIRIDRGRHFADGRHFSADVDGKHLEFDVPSYDFNTSVKNAGGLYSKEGMDLIDMFIGSEGILGIVAEADVLLAEWHPLISNIAFMPDDASALSLIKDVRHDPVIAPEFLEYFDCGSIDLIRRVSDSDPTILRPPEQRCSAVFLDMALDDAVRERYQRLFELIRKNGGDPSLSWAGHDQDDRGRMFEFRHSVPKSIFEYVASLKEEMPALNKMGTDMSVPEDRSDEMMAFYKKTLDSYGLEYVIFGHLGDFHPHVEIILKDLEDLRKAREAYAVLAQKAVDLGGSPSAEHGIGKLKRDYIRMMYGEKGIEEIRSLKRYFDPNMILNRGDMIE